jgi:hypothetical protein
MLAAYHWFRLWDATPISSERSVLSSANAEDTLRPVTSS